MSISLAGIKIDNLTLDECIEKLDSFIASGKPHLIVTPNPEIIVNAQSDPFLRDLLNNASLRLPDGVSMVVVSKILGKPLKERVSGIDFMLRSIEHSARKGYRVFLLGGKDDIAEKAAAALRADFPSLIISGTHNGYFENDESVVSQIKRSAPDILFAGLGGGRQEKWLARHQNALGAKVCVGVGGALDVISGNKKRAPKIIQKIGLEWLYRLIREPGRWKRQLALPKFLWLAFRDML